MVLYGPSVDAASTRISTGWPYAANAASPSRTMGFTLISYRSLTVAAPIRAATVRERSSHSRDSSLVHLQHHHAVRRHFDRILAGRLDVFVRPQIAHLGALLGDAGLAPLHRHLGGVLAAIEQRHRHALRQRLLPHFQFAVLADADALMTGLVLIDGDDFLVEQDLLDGVAHGAHVVPGQERRGQHAPQAHVRAVLGVGHAAVADFEHVGIVPAARTGILLAAVRVEPEGGHGVPGVGDVAVGAPQVAPRVGPPPPNGDPAVLA